jgi:hypothetical protein
MLTARNDAVDERTIEGTRQRESLFAIASDDLGYRPRIVGFAAGILALGGVGEEEVDAALQPRALEDRLHDVARRPRIGRRFEHHELARAQMPRDLLGGPGHEGQVRLALPGQRRRHGDEDGVGLRQAIEGVGRLERTGADVAAEAFRGDMPDEALAAIDLRDARLVYVEAEHREPALDGGEGQRNPDIAEPDNAKPCRAALKTLEQVRSVHRHRGHGPSCRRRHDFCITLAVRVSQSRPPCGQRAG